MGNLSEQVVDWSKPLLAVPTERFKGGKLPEVRVNREYHREPNNVPVRFDRNLWTNHDNGGTWYFTDDGHAVGGKMPEGYGGMFVVRNA